MIVKFYFLCSPADFFSEVFVDVIPNYTQNMIPRFSNVCVSFSRSKQYRRLTIPAMSTKITEIMSTTLNNYLIDVKEETCNVWQVFYVNF